MVVQEKKKSEVFRLPAAAAARVKRLAFQASLAKGRRVQFAEILTRGIDALERELAAGKTTVRKLKQG